MKVAFVAAGAGGMICGSCIRDNALAGALKRQGVDVTLLPIYTPLRTDEDSESLDRVYYGAVNIYLEQQNVGWARLPAWLRRRFDNPRLLRWVTRRSGATDARELGELALSMLRGEEGRQRAEIGPLVDFLADLDPDVVQLTNSMLLGLAPAIRSRLPRAVIVCALQGEDLFVDQLTEPHHSRVLAELRRHASDCDGFVATSEYYAEAMQTLLEVDRRRIQVTPIGISLDGYEARVEPPGPPWRIGYLARIAPEKGFDLLVSAFREVAEQLGHEHVQLEVAGYLGGKDRAFFEEQVERVRQWGLADRFRYHGEVTRVQKLEFLRELHLFSVPTRYRESKGLPVLEAMASGVPVVQPAHGSFPELIEATGGGRLVEALSPRALAEGIVELLADEAGRRALSRAGAAGVRARFGAETMAERTVEAYRSVLAERLRGSSPGGGRAVGGTPAVSTSR